MLNKVQVYSSLAGVGTITLDPSGSPETDFVQVKHVDGLDPMKANINLLSYGAIDGDAFLGSHVPSRNIVLTLGPNPDVATWSYESLRQLLYAYFMPKNSVQLVFDSDEVGVVQITGIVEDNLANQFSKEPEYIVSIICLDPFFTAVTPETLDGTAVGEGGAFETISYEANVPTGIRLRVDDNGSDTTRVRVYFGNTGTDWFDVLAAVTSSVYFDMNSRPLRKAVREVGLVNGIITSRLSEVSNDSKWPAIFPGDNQFNVVTDGGGQDWHLEYFKRYGGV